VIPASLARVSQQLARLEHHPNLSLYQSHHTPLFGSVGWLASDITNSTNQLRPRADNPAYPHFDIYPSWDHVLVVPAVKRATEAHKSHRELHQEVFPTLPVGPGASTFQPGNVPTLSSQRYPAYPVVEICQSMCILSSSLFCSSAMQTRRRIHTSTSTRRGFEYLFPPPIAHLDRRWLVKATRNSTTKSPRACLPPSRTFQEIPRLQAGDLVG